MNPTTLLLAKTQFAKTIGGFTKLKWIHLINRFEEDEEEDIEKKT